MVSELRGRSARVLSPRRERPLQRPAVSSGRRKPLPQQRGRAREGAVNQGGTTEVLCAFVLVGSCPPRTEALFSYFRLHKAQKNVLRSAKNFMEQQERENIMSKISRRDFLKVTGIAAAAAALTACGGSSSTASSTASSAAASSEVVKKLDKISVAVPNDTTNEARALALLEKNGFFKVKADAGLTATKNDIEENPFNVNIDEVEAAQVPSVLQDEDYAVINSNYAISAGLNPVEDALAIEDGSSAYVNVLVCKDGNQESPKIKALAAALESQQVKDFIDEKYAGSVVFVVENPTDGYDSTVDYDALNGETVSCAATPAPHCEILEICKDILAQKGITLDIQEFDDYIQPNNVVEDGQIDTNYFQHQPYLDDFNQEHGTHLVTVAGIHVEPMGIYGGKQSDLSPIEG